MYNLNLECGLRNAEAMGLVWINSYPCWFLCFGEGEKDIGKWSLLFSKPPVFVLLTKVSCELVNIVTGLHGVRDVNI